MVYSSDKKLCLVDNGLPESVIVIANNSKGCVPAATERLVEGIKKITGCELPVVKISEENFDSVKQKIAGKVPILLGQSAWTREMHLVPPEGCDAFTIKILPDMVVIVGNDNQQFGMNFNITPTSSGTFYGVTKFLEMQGMRFYSSQSYGQIIPSNKTITVKQQDISEKPYFRYRLCEGGRWLWRRQAGYGGNCDPWATRHTFTQLYNWEKLFTASHPEYFCLNKSNCLSNNLYMVAFPHEGVIDEIVKEAREYFSSNRVAGRRNYFLVIQNDYFKEMCSCSKCQSMVDYSRDPKGRFSDYMAYAVVKAANAVKKDFPSGRIVYCAYDQYCLPPKTVKKLPDNVIVLIAQSRAKSGSWAERNEMNALVKSWQKLEPDAIAFCRYYMRGSDIIPRFNPRGVAANIRDMKKLSEMGESPIIGEMHFTRGRNWWFELQEYITARCLWNPDLDIELLLGDFCKDSFGPAAKPMLEYINLLEKYNLADPHRAVFSNEQLKTMEKVIHQAQKQAIVSPWKERVAYQAKYFSELKNNSNVRLSKSGQTLSLKQKNASPIISFNFDESLSEIIKDSSGNGRHGILVGGKRTKNGIHKKALEFDGKNDYILLRKPVLLNKSYTLEAWIKPQKMDKQAGILGELSIYRPYHIFGSAASCHAKDRISVSIQGGRLFFHDKDIATISSSEELPVNKWSHFLATYSPQNGMRLYVNGKLAAFSPVKERKPGSRNPLVQLIGASGGISSRYADVIADCRGFFKGEIDEVKVYDRDLSNVVPKVKDF
jgi:hypothetical protein